ncbi:MAG TPA: phage terminase large subunit [Chitinophagales bacterium]|nr:phage terminase large subunit [Chitinophagales bacterium]
MKVSKQSLLRWKTHCTKVQELTVLNGFESEAEKTERVERAKLDYEFFVSYYFPHYAKNKCGKFQIDAANEVARNKKLRALFEWARGHAKSTHFDLMIPLWLKIKNEMSVMILVGKSEDNAKTLLGDLQAELQFNQRYIHDFGEQINQGSWEDGRFTTKDAKAFFALGRGQSPRGLRYRQNRPDYIVVDDIDDDELVQNESRVSKILDWILEALFNTMDMGRGRFVLVGNRIHKNSIVANFSKVPGIYHTVINALDEKGNPTWNEKYTKEDIQQVVETIGERRAQKEFFNNPITDGSVFKLKDIRFKKIEPLSSYRYIVSYTDPSFKSGTKSDFKATVVIGKTALGEYHLLKAFVEQSSVKRMVQWHYTVHNTFSQQTSIFYYMESNFLQDMLLDEFTKVGEETGTHIPIKGDSRSKPDKFQRIESMQPLFERGIFFFNEAEENDIGMKRVIEQLLMFEKGSRYHDDAPDAIEGAVWMLNFKSRVDLPLIVGMRNTGTYRNAMRF